MVKDEADVIQYTVRHLAANVDEVVVADNLSEDGTAQVLHLLGQEQAVGERLRVQQDPDPAYYQAAKMSRMAAEAFQRGHQWVVPCDADELWYATDGRRVADLLSGLARDVMYVEAPMHHHLTTPLDDPGQFNPFLRIRHRQREHGGMGKVACRLRPGLQIHQGNHDAWAPGPGLKVKGGLSIRHFPWRSEEQMVRKIRNGERAYALTDLPSAVGEHWRQFEGKPDEAIVNWFLQWGRSERPGEDASLIDDPAPYMG